MKIIPETCGAH